MSTKKKTLVIDHDPGTLEIIELTLADANCPYTIVHTSEEGLHACDEEEYSLVLLRAFGPSIDGLHVCRELRRRYTAEQCAILVLLREEEITRGAEFLIAGASDLMIGFFEPRELRMRAGIVPADQVTRIDAAHSEMSPTESVLHTPWFDASRLKFTFGVDENCVKQWEDDPSTEKIALDRMIVCPECESLPSFRFGCGSCGSAWVEDELLIHHYACAYVGPESEFRREHDIVCPKCRLTGLVAGSDFEMIQGCLRCADCEAIFTERKLIAHCLACQNRFEASSGRVSELFAYHVGARSGRASIPAPEFLSVEPRPSVPGEAVVSEGV